MALTTKLRTLLHWMLSAHRSSATDIWLVPFVKIRKRLDIVIRGAMIREKLKKLVVRAPVKDLQTSPQLLGFLAAPSGT